LENDRHEKSWALALCDGSFSAFFLGIYLHQLVFIAFAIGQLILAARRGIGPGILFTRGRWAAVGFTVTMILGTMITHHSWPIAKSSRLHWAISAFWAVGLILIPKLDWKTLHRIMLITSVPGLCYSVYWLLQPAEIAYAMKIGFHYYPRASGCLSNAIVHAEGLVILAGWSLARLEKGVGTRERGWILAHLTLCVLVVLFSRVRSGLLAFCLLFLVQSYLTPRFRKVGLTATLVLALLFLLATGLFGFNVASIDERAGLIRGSLVRLR